MNIFIGGSKDLELPEQIFDRLNNIIKKGFRVLIGDNDGMDVKIQFFFYNKNYKNVFIYFADNFFCKNNIGRWPSQSVFSYNKGFDFFADKDRTMVRAADYGIIIWNSTSPGTRRNIIDLLSQNKQVLLWRQGELIHLKTLKQFQKIDKV